MHAGGSGVDRSHPRIVEQAIDEARRNLPSSNSDWPGNRLATLIARYTRNQIEPFVDRLGQTAKLRAVPEVIAAHREGDIDWHVALLRPFRKQLDE